MRAPLEQPFLTGEDIRRGPAAGRKVGGEWARLRVKGHAILIAVAQEESAISYSLPKCGTEI